METTIEIQLFKTAGMLYPEECWYTSSDTMLMLCHRSWLGADTFPDQKYNIVIGNRLARSDVSGNQLPIYRKGTPRVIGATDDEEALEEAHPPVSFDLFLRTRQLVTSFLLAANVRVHNAYFNSCRMFLSLEQRAAQARRL